MSSEELYCNVYLFVSVLLCAEFCSIVLWQPYLFDILSDQ